MKKRIIAAMIALTLLLTVPAFALTVRTTSVKPTLTFDENVANCRVVILGDTSTAEITASIKLYENGRCIESWYEEATGYMLFTDSVDVTAQYTYELAVEAVIDGVEHPRVSIEKTND